MADDNANENPETPSGLIVTLKSLDGVDFHLPLEAARLSDLCKAAIPEDLDEVTSIETIELLRVGARALEKIVAFMTHHNEEPLIAIPDPLPYATFDEVVTQEWYRNFCSDENMPSDVLAEVLGAANYMSISPLLDLTCLKYTFKLMGKNAEEIRDMLGLPELTPEEEQRAREEHPWLFENPTAT